MAGALAAILEHEITLGTEAAGWIDREWMVKVRNWDRVKGEVCVFNVDRTTVWEVKVLEIGRR